MRVKPVRSKAGTYSRFKEDVKREQALKHVLAPLAVI
jgi:hypothetical protein